MSGRDPLAALLEHAAAHPDAVAVASRAGDIRYGDFARMVRRFAAAFARHGDTPKVMVHLDQRAEAYAVMFGAMMAGGVYAPVNVAAPETRRTDIRDSFSPDVIVTDRPFDGNGATILTLDALGREELATPRPAHRLAYVIFTSGSTGTPKGVMIPRAALAHYLDWAIPALTMGPDVRCTQNPNIGFDLSVIEIYATLCGGGTLVSIAGAKDRMFPAQAARDLGVTVWVSVPSLIDFILRAGQMTAANLGRVRRLYFCGEPLLPHHLEAIFAILPDAVVINAYGPTEATVSCTELVLTRDTWRAHCANSVALGDAIAGMSVELAGGDHPDEGEVVLAGPQLADGYWNDPERTAQAFRTAADGRRVYHTGDWATRDGDNLYFRNRLDRQVKILGNRLELDEVDGALRRAGARQAITFLAHDILVSFAETPAGLDEATLRERIGGVLPPYALPKVLRTVGALPTNSNGKVDAATLKAQAMDIARQKAET